MIDIEQTLLGYQKSLCPKIEIAALYARSNIAHKWKLTFRLISLREGISWRLVDILRRNGAKEWGQVYVWAKEWKEWGQVYV